MAAVPELLCPLPPPGVEPAQWPALTLLAAMVFGEARGEPFEGQLAVAWTAMNRLQRNDQWGKTLHAVLLQPKQFTSLDPKGPALAKVKEPLKYDSPETWFNCVKAASAAFFDFRKPALFRQSVTHFLETDLDPKPDWVARLTPLGLIGKLTFYAG